MNHFLFALINRENSLVATENYNHPFIAIKKMIFPSLPLIYAFLSLATIPSISCVTTFGGTLLCLSDQVCVA